MDEHVANLATLTVVAVVVAGILTWINIKAGSAALKTLSFAGLLGSVGLAMFALAALAQNAFSG